MYESGEKGNRNSLREWKNVYMGLCMRVCKYTRKPVGEASVGVSV